MLELNKSVTIRAPIEQVFRFVTHPANLTCFCPNIIQISDITSLPRQGSRFTWSYRLMGTRFEGFNQVVEYKFPRYITYAVRGGLVGTVKWSFSQEPDSTIVTLQVNCRAPAPLLSRLTKAAITKQTERDVETTLDNLAAVFEITESAQTT